MKRFFSPVIRGSSSSSNATPSTPTNVAEPNVEVQAQSGPNVDVLPPQSACLTFSSMAFSWAVSAFFLVLALASIESSTCHVVKGSVSCFDCKSKNDLPGVSILVKCDDGEQSSTTTTEKDGSFEAQLTTDPSSANCEAQLLGGSQQLCSYKKTMASKIVKAQVSNTYTISTPLAFSTSCPSGSGAPSSVFDSSKIGFELPLPSQWGLPPASFVIPIIPIIGIP